MAGAAVVLVVVVASALLRYWWLPSWRPDLRAGERYAIDVSAHQGRIDWPSVRRDGIDLAYIKATEGRDYVDGRFRVNADDAARSGVQTGAYHFFTLCTPGAEQAEHFRRTVGTPGPLPPAVDLELAGNCATRPAPADVVRQLDAFLADVERWDGRPVVLYVGKDWKSRYGLPTSADRPGWVRHLLFRPAGSFAIWQASDAARVDGIDAHVDLDVVTGDCATAVLGCPAQVPQKVR